MIKDRSSTAIKKRLLVLAGIIDEDYTGEIKICLYSLGRTPQRIETGDRISQIILLQYNTPNLQLVKEFEPITNDSRGMITLSDIYPV